MKKMVRTSSWAAALALAGAMGFVASTSVGQTMAGEKITLSGGSEVPPVTTTATGTGTVTVGADKSVKATITVTGMTATASHIHEGAAGTNGPVVVPFNKTGDNTFVAADGAKLTDAQFESYKAGKLYVNVHSAKNPGGEIRAQLTGK